ncbi:PadR family transcriptional regulator [Gemmatimonadota bacterium]
MGTVTPLGEFEQLILLAILRLGDGAYAVTITSEIEERAGHGVSSGAVYTTLNRLEEKGYLRSHRGDSRPMRGGRPRRLYHLEPDGLEALQSAIGVLRRMSAGLEPLLGEV